MWAEAKAALEGLRAAWQKNYHHAWLDSAVLVYMIQVYLSCLGVYGI